ncbi:phage tail protein [Pseudodesulfovibrio sp.]|uniref:phage tail protein n=1 Tax=unclassified Pseudodesulfovibrio TaxID=2661612 RepID=UPI003B008BAE
MRLLKALTKALQDVGAFKDSDYSALDQGAYICTGRDLGLGIEVARLKYDARILIENMPDRDADSLLAFIPAWLSENDLDRSRLNLNDPDIDVALNGDGTADVDITIEFDEGLYLIPDEDGQIIYNGKPYVVGQVTINVAEGVYEVAKRREDDDA